MNKIKLSLGLLITVSTFLISWKSIQNTKVIGTSKVVTEQDNNPDWKTVKFKYEEVKGIGKDVTYNRRDNSDIIKVDDTYYVWYTRMDSPQTSGYWGTIWYATSKDEGYTWTEQGEALGLGQEGEFDNHSVFTPNILVYKGKYYLYYTGVKPTSGIQGDIFEANRTTDITAIGLAVSDSPDGPFIRVDNNPVLEISDIASDFDSFRIDDTSMAIIDDKIALYYKGRALKTSPKQTKMNVAFAKHPEGPFKKNDGFALEGSHEVLIWKEKGGIAALASLNESINFAPDGIHFSTLVRDLENTPMAPGLYRPHLENGNPNTKIPGWGINMIRAKKGLTYLQRFEMIID